MKRFLKTSICALCLLLCSPGIQAQTNGYDVFSSIGKYIKQGNTEALSAWFADNLEIAVLGSENVASKQQASQIVKDFFTRFTPRDFRISHTAGRSNMKYALGNLTAGGENFRVTIFVNCKDEDCRIQELKIERF